MHMTDSWGRESRSITAIIDLVHARMATGRFKVLPGCWEFFIEKGKYCAKDGKPKLKQDDHVIDAVHKAVMMLEYASLPIGTRSQAAGVLKELTGDYDFFGG